MMIYRSSQDIINIASLVSESVVLITVIKKLLNTFGFIIITV